MSRLGFLSCLVLRTLVWSGILGGGFSVEVFGATWTPLGPPGVVISIAPDAHNPQIVYAALRDSGVWKTIDGGSTWVQRSVGLPLSGSFSIVVDPTNSSVVYASTGAERVFKTSNGGETWFPASFGLPGPTGAIAISPSTPTSLLVGAAGSLFQTRDSATTWQPVGAGLPLGVEAKYSPASSATIYARVGGLSPSDASIGLYRSSDGGATWTRLPLPLQRASLKAVGAFAVDPQNPAILYAVSTGCAVSCYSVLYGSNDEGRTWVFIDWPTGWPTVVVDSFSAVTVADLHSVYRSTSSGASRTDFSDGLLGNAVRSLVHSGNRLYAATDQSVFVATPSPPPPPGPTAFHTITPCRLVDTREANGYYGGPALHGGFVRHFAITGQCSVSATARAVSVNVTVTGAASAGSLVLFPGGIFPPLASTLNFRSGQTRASNAIVRLQDGNVSVISGPVAGNTVHFILDINGYFE